MNFGHMDVCMVHVYREYQSAFQTEKLTDMGKVLNKKIYVVF